jgi:hypothetical protein
VEKSEEGKPKIIKATIKVAMPTRIKMCVFFIA